MIIQKTTKINEPMGIVSFHGIITEIKLLAVALRWLIPFGMEGGFFKTLTGDFDTH